MAVNAKPVDDVHGLGLGRVPDHGQEHEWGHRVYWGAYRKELFETTTYGRPEFGRGRIPRHGRGIGGKHFSS